jgi:hypothetical protein
MTIAAKKEIVMTALKGGRFATVTFVKKSDGTLRKLNCRLLHVKKDPDSVKKARKSPANTISVWDVAKGAYKSFDVDTIKTVSGRGCKISFE